MLATYYVNGSLLDFYVNFINVYVCGKTNMYICMSVCLPTRAPTLFNLTYISG